MKRLEMFFAPKAGDSGVTLSYRRSDEITLITPDRVMLHDCKVVDQ